MEMKPKAVKTKGIRMTGFYIVRHARGNINGHLCKNPLNRGINKSSAVQKATEVTIHSKMRKIPVGQIKP